MGSPAAALRMTRVEIARFRDLEDLSLAAARLVAAEARRSIAGGGIFALALSGGRTPRRLYELLAGPPWAGRIPWKAVHVFWADERFVPPGHPDSNFGAADRLLLSRVPLPPENIHPVPILRAGPAASAAAYERELKGFFRARRADGRGGGVARGTFDLILLGLGADGHTASLFPRQSAPREKRRWTAAVSAPPSLDPRRRVTLTLPAINRSRRAVFLVAGRGKASALRRVLGGTAPGLPASMVAPRGGLTWLATAGALGEAGGRRAGRP